MPNKRDPDEGRPLDDYWIEVTFAAIQVLIIIALVAVLAFIFQSRSMFIIGLIGIVLGLLVMAPYDQSGIHINGPQFMFRRIRAADLIASFAWLGAVTSLTPFLVVRVGLLVVNRLRRRGLEYPHAQRARQSERESVSTFRVEQ